ncbi:hypothetical protein NUM_30810 [Actinocatenispora comari]|uniref:Uncharacterized protein n=1 Tax=Actinocatenispora comari TaxID=2807577 RepID=A0A8J4AEV9_9ACTN|nr:hypothetical protein NUM_30810 [Actinocatenispora comari]
MVASRRQTDRARSFSRAGCVDRILVHARGSVAADAGPASGSRCAGPASPDADQAASVHFDARS